MCTTGRSLAGGNDAALGDAAHGCEAVSAPARARAVAASPGLDSVTRCVRRGRARAGRITFVLDPVCFKPLARRGGAGLARNVKSDTVHAQITPLSLDIR